MKLYHLALELAYEHRIILRRLSHLTQTLLSTSYWIFAARLYISDDERLKSRQHVPLLCEQAGTAAAAAATVCEEEPPWGESWKIARPRIKAAAQVDLTRSLMSNNSCVAAHATHYIHSCSILSLYYYFYLYIFTGLNTFVNEAKLRSQGCQIGRI